MPKPKKQENVGLFYDMDLHDVSTTTENSDTTRNDPAKLETTVMRVPGGWIYRTRDLANKTITAIFVPYDEEFL